MSITIFMAKSPNLRVVYKNWINIIIERHFRCSKRIFLICHYTVIKCTAIVIFGCFYLCICPSVGGSPVIESKTANGTWKLRSPLSILSFNAIVFIKHRDSHRHTCSPTERTHAHMHLSANLIMIFNNIIIGYIVATRHPHVLIPPVDGVFVCKPTVCHFDLTLPLCRYTFWVSRSVWFSHMHSLTLFHWKPNRWIRHCCGEENGACKKVLNIWW